MQQAQPESAVILMNLGTPESPDAKSVGRFLKEFLSDSRVVEAPRAIWLPVLNGIIVPRRSRRVAQLYRSIWTESGSPIRAITERQVVALQQVFLESYGESAPRVTYAMTYGSPSLENTVEQLCEQGVERIVLLPLYPQYSGSTTGAVYDQVASIFRSSRNVPDIQIIKHYYSHAAYIQALKISIEQHWREFGRNERLLMSFHGVPKSYIDKGDPYYQHCKSTAEAVASVLRLQPEEWAFSFQSRFGPKEWVKPYTDVLLDEWLKAGVKSVDIISPAFAADCLETLEELEVEVKEQFLNGGGECYRFISCLNDSEEHIEMMKKVITDQFDGFLRGSC